MTNEQLLLENCILSANIGYAAGTPSMSDEGYDALTARLRSIAPEAPVLHTNWSDDDRRLVKTAHIMHMGSQQKANTPEEFDAWFAKQPEGTTFVVEHKLDGASIELQYSGGQMVRAVTRGDGSIGDDITSNARKMEGVPAGIDKSFSGAIRGEVLLRRSVFKERFAGEKANCRNAAVGIMKNMNSPNAQYLTVICYDVQSTGEDLWGYETHKLGWLEDQGFLTVYPACSVCTTAESIHKIRNETAVSRKELDWDIDGIVIKTGAIDRADERRACPERQIAYKFELDCVVTPLREVIWQQSGRTFTPVGIFDPVKLAGATVERASLVNPAEIERLGLRIGSLVEVVRRGEVIPKIIGAVSTPEDGTEILPPSLCPTCGTPLIVEPKHVTCPNEKCTARVAHRILCWLETLGIKGIGTATVQEYVDAGVWSNISSLYRWDPAERMFQQSVSNIYRALHSKNAVSLAQLIAGYDVPGVGLDSVQRLVDAGYRSLERLLSASVVDFEAVPGIGPVTANCIAMALVECLADMEQTKLFMPVLAEITEGALLGQSFCFTGPLNSMSRDEAELRVKAAGGQAKGSVVRGLTYLVTNDPLSGSSKNKKAQAQGTAVIDEEQFLALLKGI